MSHSYSLMHQRHTLRWIYATVAFVILTLGWESSPVLGSFKRVIVRYSSGKNTPFLLSSLALRVDSILFMSTMIAFNKEANPSG